MIPLPVLLVALSTLQVTLGTPGLEYIIATDPRNNQAYIPLARTFSDAFRNNIFDYTKWLPYGPGFQQVQQAQPSGYPQTGGLLNTIDQGVQGMESVAANAISYPFQIGSKVLGALPLAPTPTSFLQLSDGSQVRLTPHPTLPGHVTLTTPTGATTTVNANSLPPGSLPQFPQGLPLGVAGAPQTIGGIPQTLAGAPQAVAEGVQQTFQQLPQSLPGSLPQLPPNPQLPQTLPTGPVSQVPPTIPPVMPQLAQVAPQIPQTPPAGLPTPPMSTSPPSQAIAAAPPVPIPPTLPQVTLPQQPALPETLTNPINPSVSLPSVPTTSTNTVTAAA